MLTRLRVETIDLLYQHRVDLKRALENGVTKDELVEVITHLAFYAGWPAASTAVAIARQAFAEATK